MDDDAAIWCISVLRLFNACRCTTSEIPVLSQQCLGCLHPGGRVAAKFLNCLCACDFLILWLAHRHKKAMDIQCTAKIHSINWTRLEFSTSTGHLRLTHSGWHAATWSGLLLRVSLLFALTFLGDATGHSSSLTVRHSKAGTVRQPLSWSMTCEGSPLYWFDYCAQCTLSQAVAMWRAEWKNGIVSKSSARSSRSSGRVFINFFKLTFRRRIFCHLLSFFSLFSFPSLAVDGVLAQMLSAVVCLFAFVGVVCGLLSPHFINNTLQTCNLVARDTSH